MTTPNRTQRSEFPSQIHELALDLRESCPEPLKKLRASADLAGRPLCHLAPHPGGRHLVALTRAGDLVALDLKLLIAARRFSGVKAAAGPCKAAVSPGALLRQGWGKGGLGDLDPAQCGCFGASRVAMVWRPAGVQPRAQEACIPHTAAAWGIHTLDPAEHGTTRPSPADGQYLLCGSEDGSVTCWAFESGGAVQLPHLALAGAPITALDWSRWECRPVWSLVESRRSFCRAVTQTHSC